MAENDITAGQASAAQPKAGAPAGKKPPNKRVLIVVGVIALLAIGAGGRMWYRSSHFVETENAYVTGRMHQVSSRVAGVVTKVLVEDNQMVKAGDVLALLDPADQSVRVEQIQAQIASMEQQVKQSDAQLLQVRAQAGAAGAQVRQAEAQLLRARQDAERFGQLYNDTMKAVSKSEVDASSAARAGAVADVAARRDNAAAAQAQIGAAEAGRDVLKAEIKVLQAQLKDARQQLAYNSIVAPVAGRIGRRSVEVGARVQPGQAMLAVVEDNVWVVANFKETQLGGLAPGQAVSLEVDALPDHHLVGRVDSFSPASGNQFALLPADNATGNFTKIVQRVPVKITLDPQDVKKYAGRLVPGMSVVAEVRLNQDVKPTQTAAAR
ncbi:efflux RND transporter periplasmic adaptor subunit [Massilia aurea]|jgi:membrane fusion protein (multidrug efflux system)|uniref:HlyD family secretion protein n=1 Tax=Massilia aurea TaxID=373040 RepID=UPI002161BB87|nr:HlyD family secretion protein [Massilia aurea]MCS0706970.1 HlyD family secretion protein [Massilia aurea]